MHKRNIAVIGLGYVGLTVASAFGQEQAVIGYDISKKRVDELKSHFDSNAEITETELRSADIRFTTELSDLSQADFYIITVPTPVSELKHPNYSILLTATKAIAAYLKPGDIVVYESTVSPGTTEDLCIPLLETISKLKCGVDFGVGYSPERINPADTVHTFKNIIKVVSGNDSNTVNTIADVYKEVIDAGVHIAGSIKVAEAAKVIENTQRDLNISLMNEITIILHKLDIRMSEVLAAASTKWNFLSFYPGLVGGLCMSTNAYLLVHKAQELGCNPELILAGRRVNESMPMFVVDQTIHYLSRLDIDIKTAKIGVLGLSFKDNYPSFHDSKVIDIVTIFKANGATVLVHDPIVDGTLAKDIHEISLTSLDSFANLDAIVFAVGHQQYTGNQKKEMDDKLLQCKLIMDVRGILDSKMFDGQDIIYWQL